MVETNKALIKSSIALTRFDPKARKELVVRGLIALAEVMDADFYFFVGEEQRKKGELRQALDSYEKALRIDPKHKDSLFWMGYCYSDDDESQYQRAVEIFNKLINIREKEGNLSKYDYGMYYNLGNAQYCMGLYEEAIENCKQAVEISKRAREQYPEDADSYRGIGLTHYHPGLNEDTIESYQQAIELNPEDANAYYILGLSVEELGLLYQEHVTRESFEKYLILDGDKTPESIAYAKRRVIQLKECSIEVFVVDDHQVVRDGLREMLNTDDIYVIGEAATGIEALKKLESLSPDIILTNIKMPEMDGIEFTRQVMLRYPFFKVIMLTLYDEYLTESLKAGVKGYILKDIKREELVNAIRQVNSGQVVISQGVKSKP